MHKYELGAVVFHILFMEPEQQQHVEDVEEEEDDDDGDEDYAEDRDDQDSMVVDVAEVEEDAESEGKEVAEVKDVVVAAPPSSAAGTARYVIGQSPVEGMRDAVRREIDKGIAPDVVRILAGSTTKQHDIFRANSLMEIWAMLSTKMRCEDDGDRFIFASAGAKIDGIFKPSTANETDLWLPVQVRTTERLQTHTKLQKHRTNADISWLTEASDWKFSHVHDGPSVHILYVIEEQTGWILPSSICHRQHILSIQKQKTQRNGLENKWSGFVVKPSSFVGALRRFYASATTDTVSAIKLITPTDRLLSVQMTNPSVSWRKTFLGQYFPRLDAPAERWARGDQLVVSQPQRYIIGESPPEEMKVWVCRETENGIAPAVARTERLDNGRKNSLMERWALLHAKMRCETSDDVFDFTPSGAKFDAMFKPATAIDECRFLPIQIKTTARAGRSTWTEGVIVPPEFWIFDHLHDYPAIYILWVLEEQRIWILPSSICYRPGERLAIAKTYRHNSLAEKWSEYVVKPADIVTVLRKYYADAKSERYDPIKLMHYADIVFSSSSTIQMSNVVRLKRNDYIGQYLTIDDPPAENWEYFDYLIGGKRIKDQLASMFNSVGFRINLSHNPDGGKPYPHEVGEFHLLWIHMPPPYDHRFYVIPSEILAQTGHITCGDRVGQLGLTVYLPTTKRGSSGVGTACAKDDVIFNKYLFDYHDDDLEEQLAILFK